MLYTSWSLAKYFVLIVACLGFSPKQVWRKVHGSDDVSKVTLPAWPGQGYGRHRLSSGLFGPFVFLSVLGCYFALCMIWIFVCIFGFLTRGVFVVILYILLWVSSWTCVTLPPWFHPHRVHAAHARVAWWCVSKATSCELWHDCYNLQGANFGASQVVSEPRFCRYPRVRSACRITLPMVVIESSVKTIFATNALDTSK
jgi:hypothetical protein